MLGYVLNQLDATPSLAAETNREALISLTAVPCVTELSYEGEPNGAAPGHAELPDTSFLAPLLPRRSA